VAPAVDRFFAGFVVVIGTGGDMAAFADEVIVGEEEDAMLDTLCCCFSGSSFEAVVVAVTGCGKEEDEGGSDVRARGGYLEADTSDGVGDCGGE
jgi:hypothetical protein